MSTASTFDAMNLSSVTMSTRLPSPGLITNSLTGVQSFNENQMLSREGVQYAFSSGEPGRMVWLKRDYHPPVILTALVSLAAAVAVAFFVLQCFKETGKKSRIYNSLRRLSNSEIQEPAECTPISSMVKKPTALLALAYLLTVRWQRFHSLGLAGVQV
ncbi:hypothetical protein Efla_002243 [Eimeria flavescens]